jgi:hypothetical protein
MELAFDLPAQTQTHRTSFESYCSGCPACHSPLYAVQHTTYKRTQEIGTPFIKIVHELEKKTIKCSRCGWYGTPEHRYYPKDYSVTLGVITYALRSALGTSNLSAKTIASNLHCQHQVDVDDKTIQKWIDRHQDPFLKSLGCCWESSNFKPTEGGVISSPMPLDPPPNAKVIPRRKQFRATLQAKILLQQIQ